MPTLKDISEQSKLEQRLLFVRGNHRQFTRELEILQAKIDKDPKDDGSMILAIKKASQLEKLQPIIKDLTAKIQNIQASEESGQHAEQAEQTTEQTKQPIEPIEVSTVIKVIDAPCGKGKTSWAIQHMNDEANAERKYIFITPFLNEVKRIKTSCVKKSFKEPKKQPKGSKSADLKKLLRSGENIVSTHSLFSKIDAETIQLIRKGGYILILDETMDVVRQISIDKQDIQLLIDQGMIEVEDNGNVISNDKSDSYSGRFEDIMLDVRMNRLVYVDGIMLIWQFPTIIFNAFDEVYNLTYMFDGQIQKYYYDFNNVQYTYHSVKLIDERYELTEYDPVNGDIEFRRTVKEHLSIYDGPLNVIGKGKYNLSVTDYNKASAHILKKIQNNVYNFFRNITKGNKSIDNMWTCFKGQQDKLKGNGYAKGFVSYNARATNKYRHKTTLAYLVNRFPRTPINRYFQTKDIKIDTDQYALSELIQWVWRSQIRDGKSINLYIPSSRMRGLLHDWIDGKVTIDLAA